MRILMIEDNMSTIESLKVGLEAQGHSVTIVSGGRTVLEFTMSTHFDVIVLDLMPTGAGSFEIVGRLRSRDAYTPILSVDRAI